MDNQTVAVLDHGKSNVKLFICSKSGNVIDSRSTRNVSIEAKKHTAPRECITLQRRC